MNRLKQRGKEGFIAYLMKREEQKESEGVYSPSDFIFPLICTYSISKNQKTRGGVK